MNTKRFFLVIAALVITMACSFTLPAPGGSATQFPTVAPTEMSPLQQPTATLESFPTQMIQASPTPTITAVCTVTTPTNDPALVKAAIAKLNLPYVVGKPYPVVTPGDLLVYFSISGIDPASIVVDSDCTTLQLEPVPSGNGFVPVNACNPTDRKYDGWRSAQQAGVTLTDQQGFPTGPWSMEGISWAPNPDYSPILAVSGACQ